MFGVRLLLTHPELPSCEECQRWIYDPGKGWERCERPRGTPTPRPGGVPTPCGVCPKIPRGCRPHPANAIELTEENYQTFVHYQRCKAVSRFPMDPIVERNAGLLRTVEDQITRENDARTVQAMLTAVTAAAVTRVMR